MKLLFINACIRGERSRTLELCRYYLKGFMDKKQAAGEDWQLEELDLNEMEIKVQDRTELAKRDAFIAGNDFSDPMFDHAKKFMEADHILVGAPYWDLMFPAKLKVYLERCSVTGLMFIYNDAGIPTGQCRADSLMYITTSGSPLADMNYGYEYMRGLCTGLFGIKKTYFAAAESLDIIGNDVPRIIANTKQQITEILKEI